MDMKLKGQQALVTGSTAGIGYAIAMALATEGSQVTLNGRSSASVDNALKRMRDAVPGVVCNGVVADAGTAAGCAQLVQSKPRVDILVNNLGIFDPKPFEEISDNDWLHFFETNVMSEIGRAHV